MTIEDIINTVKVGTRCIMEETTYEVTTIRPYSEVCMTPQYTLKIIDKESIEKCGQAWESFYKKNPYHEKFTLEEELSMDRIEPMWFIARKVKILN